MSDFRLLMLGAMYENGGNTTHRFLDGHPELFVYPFESQVGTRLVQDHMTSMFPVKYRWPAFPLDGTAAGDYHLIIDEEGKVRSRTPNVSKFRDWPFEMNDDERKARYVEIIGKTGRSRPNNMAAFFQATFDVWKDYKRSGKEKYWVGYSPIIGVDCGNMQPSPDQKMPTSNGGCCQESPNAPPFGFMFGALFVLVTIMRRRRS